MKYDESDNVIIRASRTVTDRVGEAIGGSMAQSDMAQTMAEIRKVDPKFIKEEFVKQCQFEIIPTVLDVRFGCLGWELFFFTICTCLAGIFKRRLGSSSRLVS